MSCSSSVAHVRNASEHRASSAAGSSPTSSTRVTDTSHTRARSRTSVHARSMPVAARSTRFMLTCTVPRDARGRPSARTPSRPPSRSAGLTRDASRDPEVLGGELDVHRHERRSRTDRGRAEAGIGRRRSQVGGEGRGEGVAPDRGQGPAVARRVRVEEDRHVVDPAEPRPVGVGGRDRDVGWGRGEGHERHHVDHAEAGMDPGVLTQVEVLERHVGQAVDGRLGDRGLA